MLEKWFVGKENWAPLPMRVSLGVIFFAHGAQKVLGWFGGYGWHGTMQYFTQTLGIPAPLAAVAFLTELLGSLALLLGFGTRWAALLLTGEMTVAALKVHLAHGFFLNWINAPNAGHGIEYNLALIGATLALVITGSGRLSLDATLSNSEQTRRVQRRVRESCLKGSMVSA
jgi:putative oxidoreductase